MLREVVIYREAALAPWKNLRRILVVYALAGALGPPVIIGIGGLLKAHYSLAVPTKPPALDGTDGAPTTVPVTPPVVPTRDRDEIAALLARARTYLSEGNVEAARLVLRRAAEKDDPQAALALGGTFDPVALKRLGIINFHADPDQARVWYRRAAELGSPDAASRLNDLANADRSPQIDLLVSSNGVPGEYQPYDPPRANWGPGFVFTGDVAQGHISKVEEVCPNLYADLGALQSPPTAIPDYNASKGLAFATSMRFLKGLLGLNVDIDKLAAERIIDIKWQNLREFSYAGMDRWLESGEPRPIDRRCRLAIDDLKAKNRFKGRVFVILWAIAADSLVYEFGTGAGSASAQLWEAVRADAKMSTSLKNGTRLEIKQRLFVAYIPPTNLREWLPTGLVSGEEIVSVAGDKTRLVISSE